MSLSKHFDTTKQQLLTCYTKQLDLNSSADVWTEYDMTALYITVLSDYYKNKVSTSQLAELTDEILSICTKNKLNHVKIVCVSLYASQIRWAMNNDRKLTVSYLTHIHEQYEKGESIL